MRKLVLAILAACGGLAWAQMSAQPLKPATLLGRLAAQPVKSDDITLSEVMLFSACRQKELAGIASEGMDQQIAQYRNRVHDGSRKVGNDWIGRPQQQRLRADFERRLAEAKKILQQDKTSSYSPTLTAGKNTQARQAHEAQAMQVLQEAARNWGDPAIRDLMLAELELRAKNYRAAETRLLRSVQRDPFVAAYHQGRGLALIGMNQPLDALEEFTACLELRDDSAATYELVQKAMEAVPGAKMSDPIYIRAKELLDRYDAPKSASPNVTKTLGLAAGKSVDWLMPGSAGAQSGYGAATPGKGWQTKDETLFLPPCDRIVTKQALAVPVSEDTLLTDAQAVEGADLIYVRLSQDLAVRADLVKPSTAAGASRPAGAAGFALIRLKGVTLTPVAVDKPAALAVGQTANLQAVNLYRQQGSELRSQAAKLVAANDATKLDKSLLPGEGLGVLMLGGQYAGLISGRTSVEDPACGQAGIIPPADIAAILPSAKKSSSGSYSGGYSGFGSSGTLRLKKDLPPIKAAGNIFTIVTLTGEKPATSLLTR